jgi:hypothetical protein
MTDHVIDTNVLLVASAAAPSSPFDDSHVPLAQQTTTFDWLVAFNGDSDRKLVLDECSRIVNEYRNKLTPQDYGLQVISHKWDTCCRFVPLDWDSDGNASVSTPFCQFDPSDRKFLAAALTDPNTISIVNATDSDWFEIEDELRVAGVAIFHVIEDWLRASCRNTE